MTRILFLPDTWYYYEYNYTTSKSINIEKVRSNLENNCPGSLVIIDEVLGKLEHKSASFLSTLSHQVGPWKDTLSIGDKLNVNLNVPISAELNKAMENA